MGKSPIWMPLQNVEKQCIDVIESHNNMAAPLQNQPKEQVRAFKLFTLCKRKCQTIILTELKALIFHWECIQKVSIIVTIYLKMIIEICKLNICCDFTFHHRKKLILHQWTHCNDSRLKICDIVHFETFLSQQFIVLSYINLDTGNCQLGGFKTVGRSPKAQGVSLCAQHCWNDADKVWAVWDRWLFKDYFWELW